LEDSKGLRGSSVDMRAQESSCRLLRKKFEALAENEHTAGGGRRARMRNLGGVAESVARASFGRRVRSRLPFPSLTTDVAFPCTIITTSPTHRRRLHTTSFHRPRLPSYILIASENPPEHALVAVHAVNGSHSGATRNES